MITDTIVVILIAVSSVLAQQKCLDCTNVPEPYDCTTVTECGSSEVCYVDKYITNNGVSLYNLGCRSQTNCIGDIQIAIGKRANKYYKRQNRNVCSKCCTSKDLCNIDNLCGSTAFTLSQGYHLCYNCPVSRRPDDCYQISVCNSHQMCSLQSINNFLGETRWKHGCVDKQDCSQSPSYGCKHCCNTDLCNVKCTSNSHNVQSTSPLTTAKTSQSPNVQPTSSPTTAKTPNVQSTTTHISATTNTPLSVPKVYEIVIQPVYIIYGDTVHIQCKANGYPGPTYDYLVYDNQLPTNVLIHSDELIITNYRQENDNRYRCVATNTFGNDHQDFRLQGHNTKQVIIKENKM